jgi:hypothetical protein
LAAVLSKGTLCGPLRWSRNAAPALFENSGKGDRITMSDEENTMTTIRICKNLDSDILHLPELKPLIGKAVEIVVRELTTSEPGTNAYDAFFALAGRDMADPEALRQLRAASMI